MAGLVLVLGAAVFRPALAQMPTPTPEQIRMFQQLPPEQQRALMEQFGITGAGSSPSGQSLERPPTSQPKTPQAGTLPAFDSFFGQPDEPLRIRGGDTVLLNIDSIPQAEIGGTEDRLRQRALAANPYKLDKEGRLRIPGISEAIPLAGLTAEQATERLIREPALMGLRPTLTLLELEPFGVDALKPFGYDLFEMTPTTFAQVVDVPVPPDYTIGPGDTVRVQYIGSVTGSHSLVIGRDGQIDLPELGPISVAGMRFNELRDLLTGMVGEQMIGTRAAVSMGELRSLQVLVTGDAEQPGSYTVGGLSTVTNVLLASGGVRTIGSLRGIQLKRNGRVVTTLDLYDLLLRGDSSRDARVQSGDVIFIPPVGRTAGITGEIRRPAIYEYKGNASVWDLVSLGGGLTAEAAPRLARLERVDDTGGRMLINVDLTTAEGRATPLRPGDVLRIQMVRDTLDNAVTVQGHVYRPGSSAFRAGMRLTDVLPSLEELKPGADLNYVVIRRDQGADRRIVVRSADIARAWRDPASPENVALAPRDQVFVFDMQGTRGPLLNPILAELRRQATRTEPTQIVTVNGSVRMPGEYPLEPGMTLTDLLRAGGSLGEAAFGGEAELARYQIVNGNSRQTDLLTIDLASALTGDAQADVALLPFDVVTIRNLTHWDAQESMTLEGEVVFPGRYPIQRGETLASVIQRAGGLTDLAFIDGAVFTRESLRQREAQQIEALTARLERDLATMALQASQAPVGSGAGVQSQSAGQSLLAELRQAQPVGRLAIDFGKIVREGAGSSVDILLRDQDRLLIPRRSQEVTVLGEVQTVTSHLHQAQFSRDDYIDLSGGLTQKADRGRIYVVRANGQVVASRSRWFAASGNEIRPGDTIVVPVDTERLPPLPLWTSVTSIIYNLAIAVAAVNSF